MNTLPIDECSLVLIKNTINSSQDNNFWKKKLLPILVSLPEISPDNDGVYQFLLRVHEYNGNAGKFILDFMCRLIYENSSTIVFAKELSDELNKIKNSLEKIHKICTENATANNIISELNELYAWDILQKSYNNSTIHNRTFQTLKKMLGISRPRNPFDKHGEHPLSAIIHIPMYIDLLKQRIWGLKKRKIVRNDEFLHKRIAIRTLLKSIHNTELDSNTSLKINCSDKEIAEFVDNLMGDLEQPVTTDTISKIRTDMLEESLHYQSVAVDYKKIKSTAST